MQILLILASCKNEIFFKTFLLVQEYQLVKLLTLKFKSNLLSQTLISQLLLAKLMFKCRKELKLVEFVFFKINSLG